MINCQKSARSRGLLAFANNTADTDYESMAHATMGIASRRLGIPYTVITGQSTFDNRRIDLDTGSARAWHNHLRWQAHDLSPYDETILLDADYLVLTDRLNLLFHGTSEYLLCHHNEFLASDTRQVGSWLDPVWATVVFFRKCEKSRLLFEMVSRIERNYGYYRELFRVQETNFRNDYAFSIADLIINGHRRDPRHRMPFEITTADMRLRSIEANEDWLVVRGEQSAHVLPRQDLHVMQKSWFSSESFKKFQEA